MSNSNPSPFSGTDAAPLTNFAMIAGRDSSGNLDPVKTDDNGKLLVSSSGASGGTSVTDDAAFTVGSDSLTPVGGIYRSTRDSVDDGDAGAFAMTPKRGQYVVVETPTGDSAMDDTNDAVRVNIVAGSSSGTQYTEGDTDASITGTAMLWEDGSDTLRAVSAAKPLPVSASIDTTGLALETKQDTIIGHLDGVEGVLGTIDADTGNIATSVALIDDTVATLGTTTYSEASTKGLVIGAVRRDADTTLVDTTNEVGPVQMNAAGQLKVEVFSGETLPVSLTSTTVTGTVAVTQSGTWDEVGINDSGNSITVDGTVTAELGATDNAVLDAIAASVAAIDTDATTIIGHVDGLEGLIGTTNTNTGNAATSLAVVDDWDESDRAKVNIVVGQAGVTAGAGSVAANTPRVTLASDDPAVASLDEIEGAVETIETTVATVSSTPLVRVGIFDASDAQITTFGGGEQHATNEAYTDTDQGTVALTVRDDALSTLTEADGDYSTLRVDSTGRVWANVSNTVTVDLGVNNDVTVTSGTVDLGATDNAVLDAIAASVAAIDTDATTIIGHVDGLEGLIGITNSTLTTIDGRVDGIEALLGTIDADTSGIITATQLLDDTVYADDAAFTLTSSKVSAIGAIRDDSLSTLSAAETDVVPLRVSSTGALHVTGGGGGTEYVVDADAPDTPTGTTLVMERDDALATLTPIEGDWVHPRASSKGALWTAIDGTVAVTQSGTWDEVGINDSGNSITVDNGGTFATQVSNATSASTTLQSGATANGNGSTMSVDGYSTVGLLVTGLGSASIIAEVSNDAGTTWSAVNIHGVGSHFFVASATANGHYYCSVGGFKLFRTRIAAYSSGTITVTGTATVASAFGSLNKVKIFDNNGAEALLGNGVHGNALRVTLASDSTGQVALAAGTAGIGKLTANSGVDIGDVDVTSVIAGTGATNLGKAEDSGHSSGDTGVMTLGVANTALAAISGTTLDYTPIATNLDGRVITVVAPPAAMVRGNATTTGTSDTSLVAASGDAGLKTYITNIQISNTGSSTSLITFKDGSGGSTLGYTIAPAGGGSNIKFDVPLVTTANTALYFTAATASTTIYGSAQGYKAP